jgi:hypothetical protein
MPRPSVSDPGAAMVARGARGCRLSASAGSGRVILWEAVRVA